MSYSYSEILLLSLLIFFIQATISCDPPEQSPKCDNIPPDESCYQKRRNNPVPIVCNSQPIADQNIGDKCLSNVNTCCDVNKKYRHMDGCGNNIEHKNWGMTNNTIPRLLPPVYANEKGAVRISVDGETPLPNVRLISREFITDVKKPDHHFTLILMIILQILSHDVAVLKQRQPIKLNGCCVNRRKELDPSEWDHTCYSISVPPKDSFYDALGIVCMEQFLGQTVQDEKCNIPTIEQILTTTSFLDCSFLYGADNKTSSDLRLHKRGLLNYTMIHGRMFLTQLPIGEGVCLPTSMNPQCFKNGDSQVNQHAQLTLVENIYLRIHNKIAKILYSMHEDLPDEILFEETRKIVIGLHQHMLFGEPMKAIFGPDCAKAYGFTPNDEIDYECSYNKNVNPTTLAEFQQMAFRCFHSMVVENNTLYYENRTVAGYFDFDEWYFNPSILYTKPEVFDQMIIGLTTQYIDSMDQHFSSAVTQMLFRSQKEKSGNDLGAFDLQRGRECGIAGYTCVARLAGYPPVKTWDDLIDRFGRKAVHLLKDLYKDPDDIDALLGGLLERPFGQSMVGRTLHVIIAEALVRIKDGDRHMYSCRKSPSHFTPNQLKAIKKTNLSFFLCYGSDGIKRMQRNPFKPVDEETNPLEDCESIVNEFLEDLRNYW